MSEPGNIALQTSNLQVGFTTGNQNLFLFEPLSIQLVKGELVCFMGTNGIGKTTLLKTLAGIHIPFSGFITRNQSVAIVLTDKISGSLMTVRDLVTYGRYPYLNWWLTLSQRDHELIDHAIRLVHLESIAGKQLHQLSDGQLQMAMIAKALAQDANILLLDEPTAHLDLNNRVEIMNLLRRLARDAGKTILVATHELDLALQTADRIWLATPDQKIVTGIPEDLVLNGTFDQVFQLKGFDLKTGKIQHTPFRKVSVNLSGAGPEFLWTKNALQRNGYEVANDATLKVSVSSLHGMVSFYLETDKQTQQLSSIEELLIALRALTD
ncbi:MAG: ABC transporter ATP-binding protein [Cyclobacteriaceae bacterium]|nr:ABC transporter ATP-binding protein [Cyclobacteriaceae bacterium]